MIITLDIDCFHISKEKMKQKLQRGNSEVKRKAEGRNEVRSLETLPQQLHISRSDLMSHSCHTRGSERINFLNLCAETTFQSSLNLTFPDVNSFQTSWSFEACPSGAALVSSPAAEREQRWGGRRGGGLYAFRYEMPLPNTTSGALVEQSLWLPHL